MTQHSLLLAFSAQFIATQLLPMIHANQHTYQESYNSPRSIYTNNAGQTSNTFDHVHTIDRQDQFDNFNAEDGVTAAIITVSRNCSFMLLLMLKCFYEIQGLPIQMSTHSLSATPFFWWKKRGKQEAHM